MTTLGFQERGEIMDDSEHKIFKIFNVEEELYSPGGAMNRYKSWSPKGKSWTALSHVCRHISNNIDFYRAYGEKVVIVEYVTKVSQTIPMEKTISGIEDRKVAREQAKRVKHSREELTRLRCEQSRIEKEIKRMEQKDGNVQ
jgi:hypothetical protein